MEASKEWIRFQKRIESLTRERDELRQLIDAIRDDWAAAEAEVKERIRERDEAIAVAVWAALKGAHAGYDGDSNPCVWYAVEKSCQTRGGSPVRPALYNGTYADLFRALLEASRNG